MLPYVWTVPALQLWAMIFGLNYFSTVPPTTTLTVSILGRHSVGELSGWVFEAAGSYTTAFISAAVVAFIGGALTLGIREEPVGSRPTPTPVAV
jgi:hypothetical protein